MPLVAELVPASKDIGANHAVCFGNQEFYVQTRVSRDGSGRLESEIFHKGRLLLKRRGSACPHGGAAAAEAIRTLQDETEAWLLSKLSHHVRREDPQEPRTFAAQPEKRHLIERFQCFVSERPCRELTASERAELERLVQGMWESHSAKPWLPADAAVALLCARSFLKRETADGEGLDSYLTAIVQGMPSGSQAARASL